MSDEIENIPYGYKRDSQGILVQVSADSSQQQSHPNPALSEGELASLQGMSREGLIELIRKVCNAGWGITGLTGADLVKTALMPRDGLYDAIKLKGATLALNAKEWREFLGLAQFWAEREFGKAIQPQAITTDDNTLTLAEMIIGAHRMGKPKVLPSMVDVTPKE